MSRPILYPLRSVDTATVRYFDARHGRRRVTIEHRPLPGVTPLMLLDVVGHVIPQGLLSRNSPGVGLVLVLPVGAGVV